MKHLFGIMILLAMLNISCNDATDFKDGVWIRVVNVSDYDYNNVVIYSQEYGDLNAGDLSEYIQFDMAYRYSYVSLDINGANFAIIPIDYVGEQTLDDGYYSFLIDILSLDSNHIVQTLVKDE